MNITQTNSRLWRARIYVGFENGKSVYASITGMSKKEVELKAAQMQLETELKKREMAKPEEQRMSVGDAIDRYIENLEGVCSPTTIRRYKTDRKKFFAQLMPVKLCDLTQEAIQMAVSLDAKKYAPKSIRCAHGLLSAALDIYLPEFKLKTKLPQKIEPDISVPENDDIKRLLDKVKGTWLGGAILLGACCGLRRSEICGLKVEDIDRKKNTIYIRRTVLKDDSGKWIVREGTKTTKSKRKIEVAPFIIDTLLAIPRKGDFIIEHVPDSISKEFIEVRQKLGLNFRFHDLRHYNASIMLALNIPDKYAMERMGYSTPATLKKVYQHTMSGKRQEVTDTINSQMNMLFADGSPKN